MIKPITLYREYKRQGLRLAWSLSGMTKVVLAVARYIALVLFIVAIAAAMSRQADAINEAADNRVAAKIASQAGEIEQLRLLLASCLGDKEGAIFINGELHLCKAVSTGIRQ